MSFFNRVAPPVPQGAHASSASRPKRGRTARTALAGLGALSIATLVLAPGQSAKATARQSISSAPMQALGDPDGVAAYLGAQRAGYGSPREATVKYEQAVLAAEHIEATTMADLSNLPGLASAQWSAVGPTAMIGGWGTNNNSGFYGGPNSGRVDSLAVSTTGEIFVGTAGGGVWSSKTNGDIWTPLTDHVPTGLAIGALATDPTNAKVVYAGTGEDNQCGDCFYGDGVLKSTNAGHTWKVENPDGVFTGVDFASLVVNPNNPQDLYAGTSAGFFESTDGGAQWAHPAGTYVNQATWGVVIDPTTSPTTIYCATANVGIQKSTDGGTNFTLANHGLPPQTEFGFTTLAIGSTSAKYPNGNQTLYAGVQLNGASNANGSDLSLYRSTDGGAHWKLLTTPGYTDQQYSYGGGSADQAWYDNVLAVNPADPNDVTGGGIALVASTDGGKTWANLDDGHSFFAGNSNVIHPDQHALAYDGGSLLIGNDGGVYEYDGGFMADLNTNLETGQFYQDLGVYDNGKEITGGLQDNGTAFYHGQQQWSEVIAGDGGYNAINPLDPSEQFGEADEGLYMTTDSWTTSPRYIEPKAIYSGPLPKEPGGPDPVLAANFVPAMTIQANPADVDNPTVYYGATNLYVTTDPEARPIQWKRITNVKDTYVASITVAPSDPNVVYVGFDNGTLLVTDNATSSDPTFTDISPGVPLWITHIGVRSNDPGSIAVSFANSNTQYQPVAPMVYAGTVGLSGTPSASYTNITGNLPSGVSSNSVLFDHGSLVVATDVGVFFTPKANASATVWYSAGSGLPNVQVIGLTEDSDGNLYAATHGRGVWKLSVHTGSSGS